MLGPLGAQWGQVFIFDVKYPTISVATARIARAKSEDMTP
jgi:hypothetical protein